MRAMIHIPPYVNCICCKIFNKKWLVIRTYVRCLEVIAVLICACELLSFVINDIIIFVFLSIFTNINYKTAFVHYGIVLRSGTRYL